MTATIAFATMRRLMAVIAIGCALAGCSKCQDWRIFGSGGIGLDACKSDTLPSPPQPGVDS